MREASRLGRPGSPSSAASPGSAPSIGAPRVSLSTGAPLAPSVLPTLNDDGSRRWLKPRVSPGRFWHARRIVAYALIAIFVLLPTVRLGGQPLMFLDINARRFHIFGTTFYPTDTLLLALLLVTVFLTIFWITALLGRIWCGWACPQTVYMEFVFRPIERLFEGAPGRKAKGIVRGTVVGTALKFATYVVLSAGLAHVFLSYFVSWSVLSQWMLGSPLEHTFGFGVVVFVTLAMLFNFGYFREQTCLVACPYGRFQSVLLDRHSMIVRYDRTRGEPRKGLKAGESLALNVLGGAVAPARAASDVAAAPLPAPLPVPPGDCIDCKMCVTTCPTGIDIRNGLQMECVGCAQCIDACDAVMDKIKKPRGLIRYSSQATMEGEKFRVLRPRVLLYPAVILVLATLFMFTLLTKGAAEVTVLRGLGQPFVTMPDGRVENNLRIKIINRLSTPAEFRVEVEGVAGASVHSEPEVIRVPAGEIVTTPVQVYLPREAFAGGKAPAFLVVRGAEFQRRLPIIALGPSAAAEPAASVPTGTTSPASDPSGGKP